MTDDHAEKATRLLNIIDEIILNHDVDIPALIPFHENESGEIIFSSQLSTALAKPENADLIDWAKDHIKDLFE